MANSIRCSAGRILCRAAGAGKSPAAAGDGVRADDDTSGADAGIFHQTHAA